MGMGVVINDGVHFHLLQPLNQHREVINSFGFDCALVFHPTILH